MCEPTTIAYVAAGMMASQMMQPSMPSMSPSKPEAPPQAQKAPDAANMRRNNGAAGGINGGVASTFLTGAGGVDPNSLMLGKSTLLGQ